MWKRSGRAWEHLAGTEGSLRIEGYSWIRLNRAFWGSPWLMRFIHVLCRFFTYCRFMF